MYRKDLLEMLRDRPVSLHELALLLGVHPRELEDDLHHLIRSLKNLPCRAIITPASTCNMTDNLIFVVFYVRGFM